jgi:hypothetical protein
MVRMGYLCCDVWGDGLTSGLLAEQTERTVLYCFSEDSRVEPDGVGWEEYIK